MCLVTSTLRATERITGGNVLAVAAGTPRHPKAKRKLVRIGSSTVALAAGHRKTAQVSLNIKGRRLLAKYRVLRVSLVVAEAMDSGKQVIVGRKVLTFTARAGST
jgi:hypothetical protein